MESNTPNIFVNNINNTIDFYRALGFNLVLTVPEEGEFVWAMMTYGDVTFMFQTFASLGEELPAISRNNGGALLFYIKLKGIRKFHHQIKDKVKILKGLEKTFYGVTEFSILDNNGFVLTFAENEEE